jgi:hypothetical protein
MEAVEKYERKLQHQNRKRSRQSSGEKDDQEEQQILKKIQKYEKKLQRAREALGKDATASVPTTSVAPSTNEVANIDKSGMTLLLFYAYVEPIWKPAEHAEVMRWAQSTLDSYGSSTPQS